MRDRTAPPSSSLGTGKSRAPRDPVREYVGDFAAQLALMAREAGDEALTRALQTAVDLAMRPMTRPVMVATPLKRRA